MRTIIKVSNIQCSGCARTIGNEIGIIGGVYGMSFDIANKIISIDHTEEITKDDLIKILENLGYNIKDQ